MSEEQKKERKTLQTLVINAITVALSKNKHFSDKKVQKSIKDAASDISKKILKVAKPKKITKPLAPIKKAAVKPTKTARVVKPVRVVKKTAAKPVRKPRTPRATN